MDYKNLSMSEKRTYHRRPAGRLKRKRTGKPGKEIRENARIDPALNHVFSKIGVPEPTPFRPDPFQLEALERIKEGDVLVSAPTGAGKTWIASRIIGQYLMQGLSAWYASPLKALSNSLYGEFCGQFGPDMCGILTGERKENTGAPIIVGTTEILRNQLYDAMHKGVSIKADLVILDEAHYLSDPDRGVVWEEVLIYLPARVRLLLLSATISNAEEVCSWIMRNRATEARVVRSNERPVPLESLFLFPDGLIAPLGGKKGLTPRVKKFIASRTFRGKMRGQRRPRYNDIIDYLREFDLLPAIFFLKSRLECDRALDLCRPSKKKGDSGEKFKRDVREFLGKYPHLKGHRQTGVLLESRVASHHAGQLPYWKVLVETMMNKGYLDAIFSTSTVAAGVNFPARTVVLVQSDRYNGHEFSDLTATDLHQMIGRAGRRGKDNIGFALVVPGIYQNPKLIYELTDSPPEPLISQIKINFSMTLNLLLSHRPVEIKKLLDLSFAAFQQERSGSLFQRQWDGMVRSLKKKIPRGRCDTGDFYEVLDLIKKRSELKRQERALTKKNLIMEGKNEALNQTREGLKKLPCEKCEHMKYCHGSKNRDLKRLLKEFQWLAHRMGGTGEVLWIHFKRHLRFLKETHFVDGWDQLTSDGVWASKLRLDQPLMIAEAIRKGAFSNLNHEIMAGCIAPFVWDREQDVEIRVGYREDLDIIEEAFDKIMESIEDVRKLKIRRGFETPSIPFWPAVALFLWAKGIAWEQLISYFTVGEGDMASIIVRTADHLRQVVNLKETHPELSLTGGKAIAQILREPVFVP